MKGFFFLSFFNLVLLCLALSYLVTLSWRPPFFSEEEMWWEVKLGEKEDSRGAKRSGEPGKLLLGCIKEKIFTQIALVVL